MKENTPYIICAILFVFLFSCFIGGSITEAKRNHPEKYYQEQWVEKNGGSLEVILESGARCDILTENNAIEVDFADKWAEAIGQSLHYASQTGKRPGILLIMESEKDIKYFVRLISTIDYFELPIDVWQYVVYS